MTKQEFINTLSTKLYREMSAPEVMSQISYYQGYIDGEIAKGNPEEEVVESLGDPALIAKTILNSPRSASSEMGGMADSYEEGSYQATHTKEVESFEEEQEETASAGQSGSFYGSGTANSESSSTFSGFESAGRSESGQQDRRGTSGFAREKKTHADETAHEHVYGRAERTEGHPFRMEDGTFNWGLLAAVLLCVLIVVLVIWLVVKAVAFLWPVILIVIGIAIIMTLYRRR